MTWTPERDIRCATCGAVEVSPCNVEGLTFDGELESDSPVANRAWNSLSPRWWCGICQKRVRVCLRAREAA